MAVVKCHSRLDWWEHIK